MKTTIAQQSLTYSIWADCPHCGETSIDEEIDSDFNDLYLEDEYDNPAEQENCNIETQCINCRKWFKVTEILNP